MVLKTQGIDYRDRDLVFVDLEMTGLDPDIHEIIEIALLVVDSRTLKTSKEYYAKVAPEHLELANKSALKKSGYDKDKWKEAFTLKEVIHDISRLAPQGILAGWGVKVDVVFLEKAFKKVGCVFNFDYHNLDVYSLAYRYFFNKDIKSLNLRGAAKFLSIPISNKHDAMGDINATFEIFKILMPSG